MKFVLITGGSRGIGAAAAMACAKRGFGVILTYNTGEHAAAAVVAEIEENGGYAIKLPLDVTDISTFQIFRDEVRSVLTASGDAALYGLVNNAGFGLFNPIETVSEEEFDALFRVHLKGPFFLTQTLLPLVENGGAILNLTSATTRVAVPGVAPYASFKGGFEVLTRYMAKEFSHRRIRVNSVSPGAIRTELAGGIPEEFEALLSSQTALGRIGEASEVGRTIASLLSEDFGWVNGQSIEVSGGYCI